jgi:hypothetical protein
MDLNSSWELIALIIASIGTVFGVFSTLVTSRWAQQQALELAKMNADAPIVIDRIHRRNNSYREALNYMLEVHDNILYEPPSNAAERAKLEKLLEITQFSRSSRITYTLLLDGSREVKESFAAWIRVTRDLVGFLESGEVAKLEEEYGGLDEVVMGQITFSAGLPFLVEQEVAGDQAAFPKRDPQEVIQSGKRRLPLLRSKRAAEATPDSA